MKKVLFLIIISVAVTISALARAEAKTDIQVSSQIQVDATTGAVRINGLLPTVCVVGPRAVLMPSQEEGVLVLAVMATRTAEICIMMAGKPYELTFDVRDLKLEMIRLKLDMTKIYQVIAKDGSILFELDFSDDVTLPATVAGGKFAVQNSGIPSDVQGSIFGD